MIDPVERELSETVRVSPATTMTCRLEEHRVTVHMDLPQMEPLFRYNGIPCFFRGELTGVAGKAKSGKTYFTSVLMACCVKSGILGIERDVV